MEVWNERNEATWPAMTWMNGRMNEAMTERMNEWMTWMEEMIEITCHNITWHDVTLHEIN
jgi:hypothetical protein